MRQPLLSETRLRNVVGYEALPPRRTKSSEDVAMVFCGPPSSRDASETAGMTKPSPSHLPSPPPKRQYDEVCSVPKMLGDTPASIEHWRPRVNSSYRMSLLTKFS